MTFHHLTLSQPSKEQGKTTHSVVAVGLCEHVCEAGFITGSWMEEGSEPAGETVQGRLANPGHRTAHQGSCWLRELPAEREATATSGSSRTTQPTPQSTRANADTISLPLSHRAWLPRPSLKEAHLRSRTSFTSKPELQGSLENKVFHFPASAH